MSKPTRTIVFLIVMVIAIFVGASFFGQTGGLFFNKPTKTLATSELYDAITKKQIQDAVWQTDSISGTLANGSRFEAYVADTPSAAADLRKALNDNHVNYNEVRPAISTAILSILWMALVPLLAIGALYFFVFRAGQMGGNQAMNFGRSKAKRVGENAPKVTFDDVAGIEEAKQELFEIVDFLRNTKKYAALGAKIPKGILLTGPPGVGKTHLARAIAGEAGVPFFHISGSDFVEMFVGVGAARVRDLFETAKAHRPSLIFIDEIDAVGRQRGAGLGGGHDEREQTLNQMLVEMDGFDPNSGVILIAATNRPDVLDPALLRPGRFDRQVVVDAPDAPGRTAILKIHSKGKPFEPNVDMDVVGRRTPGFTGADLANTLNESALLAARRGLTKIGQPEIEEALDRVMAGPQRKSRIIDAKERALIAYHEAGHAIIGEHCELTDPIHKVTILPRGMSLGSTWSVPDQDKFLSSEQELLDDICMSLGGRVAEEIVYGEVYTGSSSDLEYVSRIARAMVCEYGMSEKLGTLALGRRSRNPFLGRDYRDERNYSEEVAAMIDDEVRLIVDKCHRRAIQMLTEYRHEMDAVAQALLDRETLNREEFLAVVAGKTLEPLGAPPVVDAQPSLLDHTETVEKAAKQQSGSTRLEPGPA